MTYLTAISGTEDSTKYRTGQGLFVGKFVWTARKIFFRTIRKLHQ